MERMTVNQKEYDVCRLLGKGKGGYSWLVSDGRERYVLKQIHHEPCDYYQFGDKMAAELNDYQCLSQIGIPLPRLIDADREQERILKEYIEGETIYEMVLRGALPSGCYIDYECNAYMPEWNFENWGIRYWSQTPEFLAYAREHADLDSLE